MTKSIRDNKFDTLKGILIYLVVLGHFFSNKVFLKEDSPALYIEVINTMIYSFHMPAFVFVSGYFSKTKDIERYFYRTISSILLPFIIFNTLLWLVMSRDLSDLLTPQYGMWYLISLFLWKIFVIPCSKIRGNLIYSLLFALYIGITPVDDFLSLSKTIAFFPFFLAGYYFEEVSVHKIRKVHKAVAVAAIMFSLGTTAFLHYCGLPLRTMQKMDRPYSKFDFSIMENILVRGGIFVIGFIIIFGLIVLVSERENIFTRFGEGSITIYLAHIVFVKGLDRIFASNLFAGEVLYIFISVILSAVICYMFSNVYILNIYRTIMKKISGIVLHIE